MHGTFPKDIPAPFGPDYPNLGATVARLRKGTDRKAYGAAVLDAIRAKQRAELQRELPSHNVSCASGTSHNTGKAILKAIAAKHRQTCNPDAIRKARSEVDIRKAYARAMAEKAARQS